MPFMISVVRRKPCDIEEAESTTLTVGFDDADLSDQHQVDVVWKNGAGDVVHTEPQTISGDGLSVGRNATFTLTIDDDDPTATASDSYAAEVTVLEVNNASNTNPQSVSDTAGFTVSNVDPVAASQAYTTEEDSPLSFNLLDGTDDHGPFSMTDQGPADTHSVADGVYATAEGGSATIAADGRATYSPPSGSPYTASSATDSFTYTVIDDDGGTDTATVNINVLNLVDVAGRVFNDLDNDAAAHSCMKQSSTLY